MALDGARRTCRRAGDSRRAAEFARVYRDIDHLAAAGLIDTIVAGTRPYTEREVARLLNEARRNLEPTAIPAAPRGKLRSSPADLACYGRTRIARSTTRAPRRRACRVHIARRPRIRTARSTRRSIRSPTFAAAGRWPTGKRSRSRRCTARSSVRTSLSRSTRRLSVVRDSPARDRRRVSHPVGERVGVVRQSAHRRGARIRAVRAGADRRPAAVGKRAAAGHGQ